MVKTIILSICIFLIPICTYPRIQIYSSDNITYELKAEFAVEIADSFVGIKEKGSNSGFNHPTFEMMMKNVGWYKGAPWCAYILKLIYSIAEIENTITGWSPSAYNKKNIVYTNGKLYKPIEPGDAGTLSYNKFKGNKSRYKGIGHAFIVKQHTGREGDGVYEKIRPLNSNLHITRWNTK